MRIEVLTEDRSGIGVTIFFENDPKIYTPDVFICRTADWVSGPTTTVPDRVLLRRGS